MNLVAHRFSMMHTFMHRVCIALYDCVFSACCDPRFGLCCECECGGMPRAMNSATDDAQSDS